MVGRAKNETYELVFGNILFVIGGILFGLGFANVEFNYFITWSIPIFAAGFILDVRVLRKFSFDIGNMKKSITNMTNAINQNITDIDKSKNEIEDTKNEIEDTKHEIFDSQKEINETKDHLNSTVENLENAKEVLEKIQGDVYPRNTVTDPNLLIRRFERVENYTMFDIEKQPILQLYQKFAYENSQTDLKSVRDFKLVKLLSLIYKLVWYNNSLLYYKERKITFSPLIGLMDGKNRLNQLCVLKIYEYAGEINPNLEQKMSNLVAICYNSMIDSQDLSIGIGEPDMMVKEHSVKVSEVNEKFKELVFEINNFLTAKFPEDECEKISNLEYSF